ncbi:response regulator [Candidatus Saccharibacteria bacterium]|nr:response regulator [Candidatus Saccharibacteria bacterium]
MKQILIVEDEAVLRKVYETLFTLEKFTVCVAENGQAALDELKNFKPDIIILDLLMPIMGGVEFLSVANLEKTHPATKVLVLSNLSDAETISHITELGATKYLLKAGISPRELVGTVNEMIKKT